MYICMCVYMCIYIYTYIYVYVCVCVCVPCQVPTIWASMCLYSRYTVRSIRFSSNLLSHPRNNRPSNPELHQSGGSDELRVNSYP